MNLNRFAIIFTAWLGLTACVTVNIYFPAAAADQAADQIIDNVWGEGAQVPAEATPATEEESPAGEADQTRLEPTVPAATAQRPLLIVILDWLVPPAYAADEPKFELSSPAIRHLEASMQVRYSALLPFYRSGAIGLTNDGFVAVRDAKAVPMKERSKLNRLVTEENRDRKALYRELAILNENPDWEDQIRQTFARRWITKAPGGWYYQTATGTWKKK